VVLLPLVVLESHRLLVALFIPLCGTVWAFSHRSQLGLSVAPPFGIGVPH